nr:DNA mismatch repair endonuclease MutL [Haladaptatus sp. R4]
MSDGETDIRALSETTIQRIAAGEVVERPASVVKELVENSLDADASRISVQIDGGGTGRIAVTDDGTGMSKADVQVAVEEHTTSKIRDIDDLEAGVSTLGFRGEALYTIGAVSRTKIRTKARGGDTGTELRLVGGEVEAVGPAGCPEGTTIEVTDLFFNTPARRKYLKTDSTEFAHVNRVVTQYALANPDVAFSLEHDDREVFSTTGQGNLQSTILSVYGREVATAMIPVEGDAEVGVSGHVSHPETTRSTREYVATYVNGRYVRSAVIREAILDAYGNQLAPDRYPFAVLFLDVPGDAVDVNVHPRKMEVRFGDEGRVKTAVREAVENALLDNGLIRSSAPRGRSAPDEADVAPESVQSNLEGEDEEPADAGSSSEDERTTTASEPSRTTSDPTDGRSAARDSPPTGTGRTEQTGQTERTGRTERDERTERTGRTEQAGRAGRAASAPADALAPHPTRGRYRTANATVRKRAGARRRPATEPQPRRVRPPTTRTILPTERTPRVRHRHPNRNGSSARRRRRRRFSGRVGRRSGSSSDCRACEFSGSYTTPTSSPKPVMDWCSSISTRRTNA